MDLWIRSQDRDRIIKVNNIEVVVDIKWEIYGYTSDEQYYLGQYETRERALEVLDEIQEELRGTNILKYLNKNNGNMDNVFPILTYEMPKE